jgi:hypothetical protein
MTQRPSLSRRLVLRIVGAAIAVVVAVAAIARRDSRGLLEDGALSTSIVFISFGLAALFSTLELRREKRWGVAYAFLLIATAGIIISPFIASWRGLPGNSALYVALALLFVSLSLLLPVMRTSDR